MSCAHGTGGTGRRPTAPRAGGQDPAHAPPPDEAPAGLARGVVALLALTSGVAVANLYYVQPLLHVVAGSLRVSDGTAGLLVTCAQVGYVVGLALLVPVGDLVERRRLITTVLLAAALASAACAAAPDFGVLAAALVLLGAVSVVAQIVVPLGAALAAPHERGAVVGTVMSGLLIGILTARTASGLLAEVGGWRAVFAAAAGLMVVVALMLRRALPVAPPTERVGYRSALRSVPGLVAEFPVLRQRMALGALGFAGFSVLWTSIAFLLSGAPYHYGEGVIGLFGLAGAAGALTAPLAGRFADRGHGRLMLSLFLGTVLASWLPFAYGRSSLWAVIAGVVLLDMGVQGAQISNQAAIYRLRPEARSRLTTAYMCSVFLGGVVGSVLASVVYDAAGWSGCCLLGAALAATALTVWAATQCVSTAAERRTG